MNEIDRQRISAVKKMHELGLAWHGDAWQRPSDEDLLSKTDVMHALLVQRADHLENSSEGSPERAELDAAAYEERRWPLGKVPGGKG